MESAIKKSKEAGYFWDSQCEFACDESHLMNPEFWVFLGKALNWEQNDFEVCCGCGIRIIENKEKMMDGSHKKCGSSVIHYKAQWLFEWHEFIDWVADGKFSIDTFFIENLMIK